MAEVLIPTASLLILLIPFVVFAWQYRKVRDGSRSRIKGTLFYAVFSSAPVLLYLGIFLTLVGIEEITGTALIGEGYARSLLIVSGGGVLLVMIGSLLFAVVAAFTKPAASR